MTVKVTPAMSSSSSVSEQYVDMCTLTIFIDSTRETNVCVYGEKQNATRGMSMVGLVVAAAAAFMSEAL